MFDSISVEPKVVPSDASPSLATLRPGERSGGGRLFIDGTRCKCADGR